MIRKSIENILKVIEKKDYGREGLVDTPKRVEKAFNYIYGGYNQDPSKILSTSFIEGSCEEMVILKNIEFYSMCEHHMLPFFGRVSIAYIPKGKVVGISKLARLVDCFARRLQIQEKMTTQIADAIVKELGAEGVMVVIEAEHLCMKMRGVEKRESIMVTSAIRGTFKEASTRAEFMQFIK